MNCTPRLSTVVVSSSLRVRYTGAMIDRTLGTSSTLCLVLFALLLGTARPATAQEMSPREPLVPSGVALRLLLEDLAAQPVAEWSGADLIAAQELRNAADQEHAAIERAQRLSWLAPGLGHFTAGQTGAGIGYLLAEMVVTAATVGGAVLLLPPQIRSDNLSYLSTPLGEIDEAWKQVTVAEFIPATATIVLGASLGIILRSAAARDAAETVRQTLFRDWERPEAAGNER